MIRSRGNGITGNDIVRFDRIDLVVRTGGGLLVGGLNPVVVVVRFGDSRPRPEKFVVGVTQR